MCQIEDLDWDGDIRDHAAECRHTLADEEQSVVAMVPQRRYVKNHLGSWEKDLLIQGKAQTEHKRHNKSDLSCAICVPFCAFCGSVFLRPAQIVTAKGQIT